VLTRYRAHVVWLVAYAALMTAVVVMMLAARGCALQQFGTARANQEWQAWREVAKAQSRGTGPVERREQTIAEPPALLLMREHFPAALALALVTSSALFVTMMFTLRGAFGSQPCSLPRSSATSDSSSTRTGPTVEARGRE
jgi:hypothetical protein